MLVREQLVSDPDFIELFAAGVGHCYQDVVVPWWRARSEDRTPWPYKLGIRESLARNVVETELPGGFDAWSARMLEELHEQARRSDPLERQI